MVRWPLVHTCGELPPFILFFLAIALLALKAGGGPAALATILSAVAAFTVIPATGRLHLRSSADIVAVSIFVFGGGILSLMAVFFERSRRELAAAARRQGAQQAMERTSERFALLSETAGLLLAAPRPQEVVERLCRKVMAHLDCDVFFNFLADEPTGRLRLNACAGISEDETRQIEWLDYGTAVCGCVARDHQRMIAQNIATTPDTRTALVKSYGVQAYCCHPLMAGDRLIGTLSFGAKRRARFADDEVELMRVVADQVAVAMERIQSAAALESSRRILRIALDAAEMGTWEYTFADRVIVFGPRAQQLFGLPSPRLVLDEENVRALMHSDDIPRMWQAIGEASDGAGSGRHHAEYRIRQPDGNWRWLSTWGLVEFEGDGPERKPVRAIGASRDITQRKQSEEALAQAMQRLDAHMENSPVAVIEWGPDMHLRRWSREAQRIFGWSADEVLGKGMWDFRWIYEEDNEHVRRVSGDLQRGIPRFSANRNYRKDGSVVLCHWYNSTLLDEQGQFRSILSLVLDVTEQDRTQRALQEAKATAEAASKAKDQFIAVLSHELRTPLTPAVAALSLLRNDQRLPDDVREDLDMVGRNIDLEVRLIADLLDVSRIISGKLHLEKRPADVAAAIREAARIVSGDLDAKGQILTIDTPGAPYLTHADAARLQQVFWNLLRNSIKFSPARSRISVRATVLPVEHCPLIARPCPIGAGECPLPRSAGGNGQGCGGNLVVEVTDHGSGIALEMLPKLFNPFEQEQKARSFGGLGLGLSICKAVVEMHGGSISAQSDGIGRGATFTVRLPIAQCPLRPALVAQPTGGGQPAPAESSRDGDGRIQVLVVEDHADTARLLCRLLLGLGYDVSAVGSVAEGLSAIRREEPDVLISDLGLPDGSGLDLMRQLTSEGRRIPAIALSGYGTPSDIAGSREAGFGEHLVKPLSDVDALVSAIGRLTAGAVGTTIGSARPEKPLAQASATGDRSGAAGRAGQS